MITEVKRIDLINCPITGCWLCVDADLAIGQCRLGLHGTWQHLRKMSSLVGNSGRCDLSKGKKIFLIFDIIIQEKNLELAFLELTLLN